MKFPILLSLLLLIFSCGSKTNKKILKKKILPNILIFMGDDMNWNDCEPYGNKIVKTPNIQKLANEGISLDNMFTSTAMCAPSRQQLMTGLYPIRSGGFPNHSVVYDGVRSFASYFKDIGYEVCIKCGDIQARKEAIRKSKCVAPLFNKGSYQYIGNINAAKHIGR